MKELILKTIVEGLGLGVLLVLVCAVGIRKGAVGMVHLYSREVQDRCVKLGLTTYEKIRRNAMLFKAVCIPGYIAYVLICVYAVNGANGFVDGFWVGRTKAWTIPGTEDMTPYITAKDKCKKWIFGTLGMAVISSALSGIMMIFVH